MVSREASRDYARGTQLCTHSDTLHTLTYHCGNTGVREGQARDILHNQQRIINQRLPVRKNSQLSAQRINKTKTPREAHRTQGQTHYRGYLSPPLKRERESYGKGREKRRGVHYSYLETLFFVDCQDYFQESQI